MGWLGRLNIFLLSFPPESYWSCLFLVAKSIDNIYLRTEGIYYLCKERLAHTHASLAKAESLRGHR